MDNELRDTADKLRLLSDAAYAQAAASELSPLDIASWRLYSHHEAIWAMAAQQEAAYRDLLSINVVAQTATLTRIADALERALALPAADALRRQLAKALGLPADVAGAQIVEAAEGLAKMLVAADTEAADLRRQLAEAQETNAALTRHVASVIRERDEARREADQVETQLRNRNADIAELREQLAAERGRLEYEAGAAQSALLMELADAQSRLIEDDWTPGRPGKGDAR